VLWLHIALSFLAAYHVIATCKSRKREAEASGSVRGHWVLTVVRRAASGPWVDRAKPRPPSGDNSMHQYWQYSTSHRARSSRHLPSKRRHSSDRHPPACSAWSIRFRSSSTQINIKGYQCDGSSLRKEDPYQTARREWNMFEWAKSKSSKWSPDRT